MSDSERRELVGIELTFHPEALRDLLLSHDGVLWRIARGVLALAAVWLCTGLQLSWPGVYPELPCYPALLFLLFWASRFSWWSSLALLLVAGFLLDGALLTPYGTHALLMLPVLWCVRQLAEYLPEQRHPLATAIFHGAMGSFLLVFSMLLFQGGTLGLLSRLKLLAVRGLPAAVLGGGLLSPLMSTAAGFLFRRRQERRP